MWKSRTLSFPAKTSNSLRKLCRRVKMSSLLSLLARRVLAIPATSASPKRLCSTSGNTMTKKRCSLSYDNLVYLHETWPQVDRRQEGS